MNKKLLGATLALAAASLIVSGKVVLAAGEKMEGKVQCAGANSCKGKGACAGKENACGGKNGCKGKGWNYMGSEKECTDKGGTVVKDEGKKS